MTNPGETVTAPDGPDEKVLAVIDALDPLAAGTEGGPTRDAAVFGGLTLTEAADPLHVFEGTAKRPASMRRLPPGPKA